MFRCQLCAKVVPAGTACQRVVTLTRPKKYPSRSRANRFWRVSDTGKRKEVYTDDPGGFGREIVKELAVCPECARRNGRA